MNIGCNNNGSILCQYLGNNTDASIIPVSVSDQTAICNTINAARNLIAGGNLQIRTSGTYYCPAERMLSVVRYAVKGTSLKFIKFFSQQTWDNDLAQLAVYNVMKCQNHDTCHNTPLFSSPGQNIYGYSQAYGSPTRSFGTNITDGITRAVNGWFGELQNCDNPGMLTSDNTVCGHGKQIVQQKVYKVGCAFLNYIYYDPAKKYYWTKVSICCNFSYSIYAPIYSCGAPASKCTTGANPKYPSLCNAGETY